ncbi:hypothetical protein FHS00_001047 [Limimaricola variabilis]|uniref:DUF2125 domain-containing protein n=1 Tax=Limimaricola variabilis TaxID=1492771 RepID=A0ABR6HLZ9_9RHOB|nr:hypothetical protein [Limimaricola variabilis]MBB3711485.1 hypothetical protein [Limimaricola variabilis]
MAGLSKTTAIGALLVLAPAAQAQVTAEQVWQDWQEGAARLGETRIETGAENRAGDTLTVTDLVLTMQGEDGELVVRLPEITFTEAGDGTVNVALPESYPIEITGTDEEGVEAAIDLAVRQEGLEVTVSGVPEAMRYDYAATRYALELERLTENGEVVPAEAVLTLDAPVGSYLATTAPDGLRRTEYDLVAGNLSLSLDGADTEEGGTVAIDAAVADVALSGVLALPEGMEESEALPEDFVLDFDYATGPALVEFSGDGPQGRAAGTARTAGSTVALALDRSRATYDSSTRGLELRLTESPLPLPIEIGVTEYGFGVDAPLAADAAPQDFSARLTLDGLTVGEPVWRLFDPQAVLPRSPASLIAEFTGAATLPQDLTDPETAEAVGEEAAMAEAAPEIERLTLERLVLRLAGAEILGDGAFVFDNSDLETFPGFPRPEGKLELKATGLNTLIENLAKLGALPAEQLMSTRMMLGLFTTPLGRDELGSTIEVTPEGHVMANGQRLK